MQIITIKVYPIVNPCRLTSDSVRGGRSDIEFLIKRGRGE